MRKFIYFLFYFFSFNAVAIGAFTALPQGEKIYSEYYPNPSMKFEGNIIFINGSGTDISEWTHNKTFLNCVKKSGSVFLYDRPGLGKSRSNFKLSSKNPLTAKLVSDQLTMLLKRLDIQPPYILVAHSYGALYAGYFTLKNSKKVKGLLLIDPVPRDFNFSPARMDKYNQGIAEAKSRSSKYIYDKYSGSEAEVFYQMLGFDNSKRLLMQLGNIKDDIPVVIISSTGMEKQQPLEEDWYASQKQWLNKNPMSKIIKVSSDHFIQIKRPQQTCNELIKILNAHSNQSE